MCKFPLSVYISACDSVSVKIQTYDKTIKLIPYSSTGASTVLVNLDVPAPYLFPCMC